MASVLASENTKSHGRRDGELAQVLRHGDPSLNPDSSLMENTISEGCKLRYLAVPDICITQIIQSDLRQFSRTATTTKVMQPIFEAGTAQEHYDVL